MSNKITFFRPSPRDVYLAFSGGVDSAVLLKLLSVKKIKVTLLWIDHYTEWCVQEEEFAREAAKEYGIPLVVRSIGKEQVNTSLEAFWSVERDKIYQSMDKPVLTGHHLNDAVEWYLMSTFQGTPKLINYQNRNVIRPLLLTKKQSIIDFAMNHSLSFISDPSNQDSGFNLRNKVRIKLMPNVIESFPGIYTTVARLIRMKERNENG